MAQSPVRRLDSTKCPVHSRNEVIYVCEEESCHGGLACCDCVSTEHRGHRMQKLGDFVVNKKEILRVLMQQIDTEDKPRWLEKIDNIDVKVGENKSRSQKIEKEIKEKRIQLNINIDKATDSAIGSVTQVFEKNCQILRDHKEKLLKGVEELNQRFYRMEEILEKGSNIDIYQFDVPSHALPMENEPVLNDVVYIRDRLPSSAEMGDSMFTLLTAEKQKSQGQLELGEIASKPVTHFELKGDDVFCPTHDDCFWIGRYEKPLLLMNSKGKIKQEFNLNSNLRCIYLSPEDILWMICEDKTVRSITSTQTVIIHFSITKIESAIFCITSDNKILIANLSSLSLYTKNGEVICTHEFKAFGESTIKSLLNIVCCSLSGLVVITDYDTSKESGSIAAFNPDLTFRFRFKGYNASSTERKDFRPMGVTFDSAGNVLIADAESHYVILVNPDGLYERKIVYTGDYCCPKQLWFKKETFWMSVLKRKNKTFGLKDEVVAEIRSYRV